MFPDGSPLFLVKLKNTLKQIFQECLVVVEAIMLHLAVGVPAFSLSSLDWSYRDYTWHSNIDTYDKIVFDDVRSNVILTAILAYMASEDKNKASREKRVMPINPRTGKEVSWPSTRNPRRERAEIF